MEVVALPLIFEECRKDGKSLEQVFEAVKVCNSIPAELESTYRETILRAYAEFDPSEKHEE